MQSLTDPIRKRGDNRFNEFLPELSNELASKLAQKGSGRITFGKYAQSSKGMARHTDIIVEKDVVQTGVIYLNSVKNQGHTVLFLNDDEEPKIEPVKGRLLLFDVSIPHEALPPLQEKYILIFRVISALPV